MPNPLLQLAALACIVASAQAQSVFINELHYDNASVDANEGVEIAGPAGTDLSHFKLVFYNGATGTSYGELPLGGTIPAQAGTAFGTAYFPRAGIQNGAPDGIALIDVIGSSVVQFLSYEGSFQAIGGEADGEISTDIGVAENGSSSGEDSLQLSGSGAVYSDFAWASPSAASPGAINPGQHFLGAGMPSITLTLMPSNLREGDSGAAMVSLFPNPPTPVTVSISNSDRSELITPDSVTIPASGSASFTVTAVDDLENDGTQAATLTASAPLFAPASATSLILDVQRPARSSAIRLATINTLNGVGTPGSPEFQALFALINRLEPDLVAFQEVSSAGDFFDLKELLADLGIPHLATTDDGFVGHAYEGGQFNTDQNLAIASRHPITRTIQIGRAQTDRREFTRFPLMVEIDVPGVEDDPVIVAVHYKANTDDSSRYRKAIEAYRTLEALANSGYDGASDPIFVLGDFNEDHDRFMPGAYLTGTTNFGDGSALPASYQLGSDLAGDNSIQLPYAQFPDRLFAERGLITPFHKQQDGQASRTFIPLGDAALDYILHSQRVAENGNVHTEIYNSSLDRAFDGLAKQADPPPPSTSFAASDHFAIIGDYELDPKPKLSLSISPSSLPESAGRGASTATVTLAQAAAVPIEVTLSTNSRDTPIGLPINTTVFEAGETQKSIPIDVLDRPGAAPDRAISITASADAYSAARDTLVIYNLDPVGRILLSQYVEPPSGSSPRGIELFNCGTSDIDLRAEPIRVIQYTNGSSAGSIEATATAGIFPARGVVVIGDAAVGSYLVAEGLLPSPDPPIAGADYGTHYFNPAGELVYVKAFFAYNGDDALEIDFAYGLSDVFGKIGEDPGTAWQSDGVITSGRNLSLRDDVATASAGFSQPHRRFVDTSSGSNLEGFGIPPAANDPFKLWLEGFGLSDPHTDPDGDGLSTLVEFATASDPLNPSSAAPPTIGPDTFSHRRLGDVGRLNYLIEASDDLIAWRPADLIQSGDSPNADGSHTVSYQIPPAGERYFLRLRVTLE